MVKLYSKQYCYYRKVQQAGQPRFQTVRLDVVKIKYSKAYIENRC